MVQFDPQMVAQMLMQPIQRASENLGGGPFGIGADAGGSYFVDPEVAARTGYGTAVTGTSFFPGAGIVDAAGGAVDVTGQPLPSFSENIREGQFTDAGLQALGVAGDIATIAAPLTGGATALLGAMMKAPGAARKVTKATDVASDASEILENKALKKFAYFANKEGGQTIGNKTIITDIDKELFENQIKPLLASDQSFEDFKKQNLKAEFTSVNDGDYTLSKVNEIDDLLPTNEFFVEVDSFSDQKAIKQRNTFDSDVSKIDLPTDSSKVNNLDMGIIKAKQVSEGSDTVLEYPNLFHGSTEKGLEFLDIEKSRRTSMGAIPAINATENKQLATAFTRGELGDKPEGEIYNLKGPFRILNLESENGRGLWEDVYGKDPQKALKDGYDGIQFNQVEDMRVEAFYKDIDLADIKGAKEIQLFKPKIDVLKK